MVGDAHIALRPHYAQGHSLSTWVCIVKRVPPPDPSSSSLLGVEHRVEQSEVDEGGIHANVLSEDLNSVCGDLVRTVLAARNAFAGSRDSRGH